MLVLPGLARERRQVLPVRLAVVENVLPGAHCWANWLEGAMAAGGADAAGGAGGG